MSDPYSDNSKTALVTGATGFTGSHLALALASRGYRVRTLARPGSRIEPLVEAGIEICEGDLIDRGSVRRATQGVSHVYHIAAAYRSAKHPDSFYWDVNVGGTVNALDAARDEGVERFVHCSTVGVHGDIKSIPADESAPFSPGDVYQDSKLEGERKAQQAIDSGMPVSIFRPAGIHGPGDLRFLKLFRTIHNRRFRMFGSGKVLYHMTYIDDLVDGIILCGEHPAAVGEAYILAGPQYTTLNELVAAVGEAVSTAPRTTRLPVAPLMAAATACEFICRPLGIEPPLHRRRLDFFLKDRAFSIDKARTQLGYQPRVSLGEGLRRTAEWYFEHGYLTRAAGSATVADGRQR